MGFFLAFARQSRRRRAAVVTVSYAPNRSQCYLRLPFGDLDGGQWKLADRMEDVVHEREGKDLQARGLYLDTPAWKTSVFALTKET